MAINNRMRITRIHIKIKNQSDHNLTAFLLNAAQNKNVPGNNLSDVLKVSVKLNTTEMNFVPASYQSLLDYLSLMPLRLKVIHTTNNRQLSFFADLKDFDEFPIEIHPKNNKIGQPFSCHDMIMLSDWNIADSGDIFDGVHEEIRLDILPKQEFNIFLSVKPEPKIIDIIPAPLTEKKNNPIKTYLHHFASPNDTIDQGQKKPCLCKKALTYSKFTDCDGNCTF